MLSLLATAHCSLLLSLNPTTSLAQATPQATTAVASSETAPKESAMITTRSNEEWNVPNSMREATRPHLLELSFGFARGGVAFGWWGAELSYLYHLWGGASGPAIGGVVGGHFWGGAATFSAMGKFQWDFKLFRNQPLALFVAPYGAAGYQHTGIIRYETGITGRLVFVNRWTAFIRHAFTGAILAGDQLLGRRHFGAFATTIGGGVTF